MSGFQLPLLPRLSFSDTKKPTVCIIVPCCHFLPFLFISSSFLICSPWKKLSVCETRLKNSAGLRLAPIIRAWQGAAVSTCQTNKHPLWHSPSYVWSGVSQPLSSGPLILLLAHGADTSTPTAVDKGAIVLQCRAAIIVTHGLFASDEDTNKDAQLRKSLTLGGCALCPCEDLYKRVYSRNIGTGLFKEVFSLTSISSMRWGEVKGWHACWKSLSTVTVSI